MTKTQAIRKYADAVEAAKWCVTHGHRITEDEATRILEARREVLRQEIDLEDGEDVRALLVALMTAQTLHTMVRDRELVEAAGNVIRKIELHVAVLLVREWYAAEETALNGGKAIDLSKSEPAMAEESVS